MASRKIEVAITGSSSDLERAFKRSGKAAETFGHKMKGGLGSLAKGVGVAGAVGVGLISAALFESVKAAGAAEVSQKRLTTQLSALGKNNAAVRGNIDETVASLSNLGGFKDTELQDSFTRLVRSSNNVKQSQRDLGLVADIAASGTMNLGAATKAVQKIEMGSYGSAKKLGLVITKNMTQEQVMAKARKLFAGQAEKYGKTMEGSQKRLGAAMERAQVKIGTALLPVISGLADLAGKYLPAVSAAVSLYLGKAISWIKQNWPKIRSILEGVLGVVKTLAPHAKAIAIAVAAFAAAIIVANTAIKVFEFVTKVATIAQLAWNVAMSANPIGLIIIGIAALVVGLILAYKHFAGVRVVVDQVGVAMKTGLMVGIEYAKIAIKALAHAFNVTLEAIAGFWRGHGDTIKAILNPLWQTIKTVVLGTLTIIRNFFQIWVALFHGDWGRVWSLAKDTLKTAWHMIAAVATVGIRTLWEVVSAMASKVLDALKGPWDNITGWFRQKWENIKAVFGSTGLVGRALQLGKDIIDGVIQGIKNAPGKVKDALVGVVDSAVKAAKELLHINSPSRYTMNELGMPMVDGVAAGIVRNGSSVASALQTVLEDAVSGARSNLSSLLGGLTGMLGRMQDVRIAGMTSSGSATSGQTLSQIRAGQDQTQRDREKARLDEALANASTDEERKQAIQDLSDWQINEEARVLEESQANATKNYDQNIQDLADSFNAGTISATDFQTQLTALIGGDTGSSLGSAFATAFGLQLKAVTDQIGALGSFAGVSTGAPGSIDPAATVTDAVSAANAYEAQMVVWRAEKKRRSDALQAARDAANDPKGPEGKTHTKAEQTKIDNAQANLTAWDSKKPDGSAYGLASGGIIRKTLFAVGEAGPEAIIPLGSGSGRKALSDALASNPRSGGGETHIHVTVSGNEFSARDFAAKLAPELRRQVSLGRSA